VNKVTREEKMARYYFHVRDQHGVIRDEEGTELAGLEDAIAEAQASARDFLVQDIKEGRKSEDRVIEIADDLGKVLARVPLGDVMPDSRESNGSSRH